MQKARPTFLGIGAHRAGTTWLYEHLNHHPEIWIPPVKEVHFFDRSPNYPSPNNLATSSPLVRLLGSKPWQRAQTIAGLNMIKKHLWAGEFHQALWESHWTFGYYNEHWYAGLFRQAESYKACGEITPSYSILKSEDVAQIKALNPDIKLIFMIRNPIERAWSSIRFNVHENLTKTNLDSDDGIISELKSSSYVLRGDYERTLDTYLKYFDSRQILVCFYDAIKCDASGLMSGITTFLEVEPLQEDAIDHETRVNASPTHKMSSKVRDYLLETYAPMINRFAERFGSYATMWDGIDSSDYMKAQRASPPSRLPSVLHP